MFNGKNGVTAFIILRLVFLFYSGFITPDSSQGYNIYIAKVNR